MYEVNNLILVLQQNFLKKRIMYTSDKWKIPYKIKNNKTNNYINLE